MKRFLLAALLAFTIAVPGKATTYTIDFPQLSGFIETDGTLGFLQASNISNFSVSWNGGGWGLGIYYHPMQWTYAVVVDASALWATPDQLLIEYNSAGPVAGQSQFRVASHFGGVIWDPVSPNQVNYQFTYNDGVLYAMNSGFIDSPSVEIAVAAVPEASTWALMLLGFAGLGFATLRQSRKAAGKACCRVSSKQKLT
jgi:hypothetical protein